MEHITNMNYAIAFIWVCESHSRTLIIPTDVFECLFRADHIYSLPLVLFNRIEDTSHWIRTFTDKHSNDELVDEFFNEVSQHPQCREEFHDDHSNMLGQIPPNHAIVQWYVRV